MHNLNWPSLPENPPLGLIPSAWRFSYLAIAQDPPNPSKRPWANRIFAKLVFAGNRVARRPVVRSMLQLIFREKSAARCFTQE